MILIPFLEAVSNYSRLKALRYGEKQLRARETTFRRDIARIFRLQGSLFQTYLPDTFDIQAADRAWDQVHLETKDLFKQVVLKHKKKAADIGIEVIQRELSGQIREAARPREMGMGISFDGFNQAAYEHLEEHAGDRISKIDDTTRNDIRKIITDGFKGELQDDGTTKYKSYQQIARDIKDRFGEFSELVPQGHIRDRAELIAVTELRDAYETSKQQVRDGLKDQGWDTLKKWQTMGDDKVSDGCETNSMADWIDNREAFPSGHMSPPRFPGCRCHTSTKLGDPSRKTDLPDDRWLVTRDGDTISIKKNPKYKDGYF